MSIRLLCAVIAVVAVPMAVAGQQPASAPARPDASARRYCDAAGEVGSRLRTVRRCETKAQREARKQEARQVVDRVQALKPTFGK